MDGVVSAELGLKGKPEPDIFVTAAKNLGCLPARTIVFEDAVSGVQAGAKGQFGLVVGLAREHNEDELRSAGADVVFDDWGNHTLADLDGWLVSKKVVGRSPGYLYDCAVFDLDGVITKTAKVHSLAWKATFDDYLKKQQGSQFQEFTEQDYLTYVDGKPRYDGVQSFLQSRGISLPFGDKNDPAGKETVCGIGNVKNDKFLEVLASSGIEPYDSTVRLLRELRAAGLRVGVASSSKNCEYVLKTAGLLDLMETRVDGVVSAELGLKGKPEPDIFVTAAKNLGCLPARTIVFEDAVSGVQAGAKGQFGLVVGLAREHNEDELRSAGADVVFDDWGNHTLRDLDRWMAGKRAVGRVPSYDCAVFDLDGVITKTAKVHSLAWKATFDDYLKKQQGSQFQEFTEQDYLTYVDGKPRYDGVQSFLQSRGISLPFGDKNDPAGKETVCGIGNVKNDKFLEVLASSGIEPYDSTVRLLRELRAAGLRVGVASSSKNCEYVLKTAGLLDLMETRVDGVVSAELGLKGKPEPDIFVTAAKNLGCLPARTIVFEDAVSGVQAGAKGQFGLVVGLAREHNEDELRSAGADVVFDDWGNHTLRDLDRWMAGKRAVGRVPSYDCAVFDLDGVITKTAKVHSLAWKATFDDYLKKQQGSQFQEFTEQDYLTYVDGKPRYDGVQSFLQSRGISLPFGDKNDPAGKETVCGIGNVKNDKFLEVLASSGIEPYDSTVRLLRELRAAGLRVGVASSSKNCEYVLKTAGLLDLMETRVDGVVSAELGLKGKPEPDIFVTAAKNLGCLPARTIVFEDAVSGVQAGAKGQFGLVVGLAREHNEDELRSAGADVVFDDWGNHTLRDLDRWVAGKRAVGRVPSYDCAVFDLDGVITKTAKVHSLAWKATFDDYLKKQQGSQFQEFTEQDYLTYVDGKPRYDGVQSFLQSRGISLPFGDKNDPAGKETVCGIGNVKNDKFLEVLASSGIEPYDSTVQLLRELRAAGLRVGVASSSKNCEYVLKTAGLLDLMETRVDGVVSAELGLKGKPEPDIFVTAAKNLGCLPARTIVFEDAVSGVQAGAKGQFGLVVGLAREHNEDELRSAGADVVFDDWGNHTLRDLDRWVAGKQAVGWVPSYDCAVFDLDGVITKTAKVHSLAWKATFDDYLKKQQGSQFQEFTEQDYLTYVDGKPRYDGVQSFLQSRGISLPFGDKNDPAGKETVCGIGNVKNDKFLEVLASSGIEPYDSTVRLLRELRAAGLRVGVASSSKNCEYVLKTAGLLDLMETRVDGVVSAELGLKGKPEPDIFVTAAKNLGCLPARTIVFEDAVSGVQAGAKGQFGLVVGLAREHNEDELRSAGADVVFDDWGNHTLADLDGWLVSKKVVGRSPGYLYDCAVFDLDGVITKTAKVHSLAWKATFDDYLKKQQGSQFQEFTEQDYLTYVDGKPRYDGVQSFLQSRGISLPFGDKNDPAGKETVCGIGNVKNDKFLEVLASSGIEPYDSTVRLLRELRAAGLRVGVASSSKNCEYVLKTAGLLDLMETRVDGVVSAELGLKGKPEPDIFVTAAKNLGCLPARTIVFEDAVSGVQAGAKGQFGLVVGLAREHNEDELRSAGADVVFDDWGNHTLRDLDRWMAGKRAVGRVPSYDCAVFDLDGVITKTAKVHSLAWKATFDDYLKKQQGSQFQEFTEQDYLTYVDGKPRYDGVQSFLQSRGISLPFGDKNDPAGKETVCGIGNVKNDKFLEVLASSGIEPYDSTVQLLRELRAAGLRVGVASSSKNCEYVLKTAGLLDLMETRVDGVVSAELGLKGKPEPDIFVTAAKNLGCLPARTIVFEDAVSGVQAGAKGQFGLVVGLAREHNEDELRSAGADVVFDDWGNHTLRDLDRWMAGKRAVGRVPSYDCAVFDLDGVITKTAKVHSLAWKATFDDYLKKQQGSQFKEFTEQDYLTYVDGKPRYDGVQSFLQSRGISLPFGDKNDPAGKETVCGIGNVKNDKFLEVLASSGIEPYDSTVRLLRELRAAGLRVGVASSSKNCEYVLKTAGLLDLMETRVDGVVSAELGLKGKPEPDIFVTAAKNLGCLPARTIVFEDAVSGVQAGAKGQFGLVVGLAREHNEDELRSAGADVVFDDWGNHTLRDLDRWVAGKRAVGRVPSYDCAVFDLDGVITKTAKVHSLAWKATFDDYLKKQQGSQFQEFTEQDYLTYVDGKPRYDGVQSFLQSRGISLPFGDKNDPAGKETVCGIGNVKNDKFLEVLASSGIEPYDSTVRLLRELRAAGLRVGVASSSKNCEYVLKTAGLLDLMETRVDGVVSAELGLKGKPEPDIFVTAAKNLGCLPARTIVFEDAVSGVQAGAKGQFGLVVGLAREHNEDELRSAGADVVFDDWGNHTLGDLDRWVAGKRAVGRVPSYDCAVFDLDGVITKTAKVHSLAWKATFDDYLKKQQGSQFQEFTEQDYLTYVDGKPRYDGVQSFLQSRGISLPFGDKNDPAGKETVCGIGNVKNDKFLEVLASSGIEPYDSTVRLLRELRAAGLRVGVASSSKNCEYVLKTAGLLDLMETRVDGVVSAELGLKGKPEPDIFVTAAKNLGCLPARTIVFEDAVSGVQAGAKGQFGLVVGLAREHNEDELRSAGADVVFDDWGNHTLADLDGWLVSKKVVGRSPGYLYDCAVFDLDGVITKTAKVHSLAWKATFDDYLKKQQGSQFQEFTEQDYLTYVDGKPRYDGVQSFLQSRGISLPFGDKNDPAGKETVCGIGNVKNDKFLEVLASSGIEPYDSTVRLLRELRAAGLRVGVASSSKNCEYVLKTAGLLDLMETRVDGVVSAELGLKGKPEPDIFVTAAKNLGCLPARTIVFEDAVSGVQAGAKGQFGLVVGLAREHNEDELRSAGADVVFDDWGNHTLRDLDRWMAGKRAVGRVPSYDCAVFDLDGVITKTAKVHSLAWKATFDDYLKKQQGSQFQEFTEQDYLTYVDGKPRYDGVQSFLQSRGISLPFGDKNDPAGKETVCGIGNVKNDKFLEVLASSGIEPYDSTVRLLRELRAAGLRVGVASSSKNCEYVLKTAGLLDLMETRVDGVVSAELGLKGKPEPDIFVTAAKNLGCLPARTIVFEDAVSGVQAGAKGQFGLVVGLAREHNEDELRSAGADVVFDDWGNHTLGDLDRWVAGKRAVGRVPSYDCAVFDLDGVITKTAKVHSLAWKATFDDYLKKQQGSQFQEFTEQDYLTYVDGKPRYDGVQSFLQSRGISLPFGDKNDPAGKETVCGIGNVKNDKFLEVLASSGIEPYDSTVRLLRELRAAGLRVGVASSSKNCEYVLKTAGLLDLMETRVDGVVSAELGLKGKPEPDIFVTAAKNLGCLPARTIVFEDAVSGVQAGAKGQFGLVVGLAREHNEDELRSAGADVVFDDWGNHTLGDLDRWVAGKRAVGRVPSYDCAVFDLDGVITKTAKVHSLAWKATFDDYLKKQQGSQFQEFTEQDYLTYVDGKPRYDGVQSFLQSRGISLPFGDKNDPAGKETVCGIGNVKNDKFLEVLASSGIEPYDSTVRLLRELRAAGLRVGVASSSKNCEYVLKTAGLLDLMETRVDGVVSAELGLKGKPEPDIFVTAAKNLGCLPARTIVFEDAVSGVQAGAKGQFGLVVGLAREHNEDELRSAGADVVFDDWGNHTLADLDGWLVSKKVVGRSPGYLYDCAVFDLDGVITKTAKVHSLAWKATFDDYLKKQQGSQFQEFTEQDYLTYVDGKPRYDGVQSFLQSRGISLPFGDKNDPAGKETVCGIGNVKNDKFLEVLASSGIEPYDSTVRLLRELRAAGLRVGVASSSKNCEYVLKTAGLLDLMETRVDGVVSAELGLKGKPEPDIFVTAAKNLGCLPARTIVFEDAVSGVQAGAKGQFGLVVGLAREHNEDELRSAGADVVFDDWGNHTLRDLDRWMAGKRAVGRVPSYDCAVFDLDGVITKTAKVHSLAWKATFDDYLKKQQGSQFQEFTEQDYLTYVDGKPRYDGVQSFLQSRGISLPFGDKNDPAGKETVCGIGNVKNDKFLEVLASSGIEPYDSTVRLLRELRAAGLRVGVASSSKNCEYVLKTAGLLDLMETRVDGVVSAELGLKGKPEPDIFVTAAKNLGCLPARTIVFEDAVSGVQAGAKGQFGLVVGLAREHNEDELRSAGADVVFDDWGNHTLRDLDRWVAGKRAVGRVPSYDCAVFDLDGVITKTAKVHSLAWKATFDDYLKKPQGSQFQEFTEQDYLTYVDGKPRYDGVQSFLQSRGISLPFGDKNDPAGKETVCGIGNVKNDKFLEVLASSGIEPYDSTVRLLRELRAAGLRVGVASSSKNCEYVLKTAGLLDLMETRVDGVVSAELGLKGKPEPDIFVTAAKNLGCLPARTIVFEDAVSGVQAGAKGQFGLVVGLAREHNEDELRSAGADVVFDDWGNHTLRDLDRWVAGKRAVGRVPSYDCAVFDLDGVITKTAKVHSLAWKATFDDYLKKQQGSQFQEFTEQDYLTYVDGKPRYDGVQSFLQSRGISLPFGDKNDPAGKETVCGIGNVKNDKFLEVLASSGIEPYDSTVRLLRELRAAGLRVGVASSSKNCEYVLKTAGLLDLMETRVDGVVSAELGLKGKPEPDIFVTAAKNLGCSPERTIVFEDAVSGVQAGAKGQFGLVVGLAREHNEDELRSAGADVVFDDWGNHTLGDLDGWLVSKKVVGRSPGNFYDCAVFDLDGVITKTAKVHSLAWKATFDDYLKKQQGSQFQEFTEQDYLTYVDGKPRYDGVQSFLQSRGISLPFGDKNDPAGKETVCGIGNVKNDKFLEVLASSGIEPYDSTVRLLRELRAAGLRVGVASSSKNCEYVLKTAGLLDLMETRVDGVVSAELGLKGKPEPDIFVTAAKNLGCLPARTIVFEDAVSGVQAGAKGQFGLVVGLAREHNEDELRSAGADVVFDDWGNHTLRDLDRWMAGKRAVGRVPSYDCAVFDLDGVITKTAKVHSLAWKATFDDYLKKQQGSQFQEFTEQDYLTYVDGKPRYDGVQSFLQSRGISLPFGDKNDPAGKETVCGIGNVKNDKFLEVLASSGIEPYDSTVRLLRELRAAGLRVGVASSSKNCEYVLKTAGLLDLMETRVDGVVSAELGLKGKPEPDIFVTAAKNLGCLPARTIVFEDAVSGVQAGAKGQFGLVVGLAREHNEDELRSAGADVVFDDWGNHTLGDLDRWVAGKRAVGRVPSYDCAVFDLDGVITKTAKVHSLAWKATFDDYLKKQQGSQFQEFTEQDYLTYVDGKPRYDGVQSFLQSRGISLLFGDKNDPAGKETVCGIGNVKNDKFLEVLASSGIEPYDSTVRLLRELRAAGLRVGVASSSKNCEYVLKTAGLLDLMETRVDGVVSAELGLKGKPEPDIFVTAAKNLGCLPARTIVFEDAVSGVQAGAKGQFGLVVGLAREHNEDELRSAGADVVFDDWGNHTLRDLDRWVAGKRAVGRVPSYDCAVFDLDGVITKTAKVHSLAWKATFDDYLKKQQGSQFQEFTEQDYLTYVDGKPRYDGVQSFLQSRGISLPFGDKNDPAGKGTVCGIGNVKNDKFLEVLASSGIEPYDSTVRLLRELRAAGLRVGVASSSKNCEYVLKTAGLLDLMETRVDGVVSAELGLKGKPEPDIFVTAAKNLGCLPARTIVFEDAVSGVQAGAKGQFGLVVGLAREHNEDELRSAGADVVFDDWGNHTLRDLDRWVAGKRFVGRVLSFHCAVFDLDGVITKTAKVHSLAWKATFDDYLKKQQGSQFQEFTEQDYLTYVDGKPRYDGVQSFLQSRGISLPFGDKNDPAGKETVCGIGNVKNDKFLEVLASSGIEPYDSTVRLLRELRAAGLRVGVASSSKNCEYVLKTAGLLDLMETRVDGVVSAELGLKGKPEPDIFVTAAKNLGCSPERTIVFEDAVSGVQAGAKGQFGLVVGLAREHNEDELRSAGADVVFDDWGNHTLGDLDGWLVSKRVLGRSPGYLYDCAVFDLDGVITKTAKVHSLAWKATFDDYLKKQQGSQFQEFTEQDYLTYVDGKPRYDGVQSFLQSRGISLPFGDKNDPAGKETVCGIGNVKNDKFLEVLASSGIEPYDSTVRLLRELRAAGLRVGVASSSKNCEYVLKTAGLLDLMETRVDGVVSAELGLKGKPEPDIFVTAAKNLGCLPARTIVFEDAVSGVQAGAKGQFGLVVGLAREHNEDELRSAGADVVFDDWGNHTLRDLDRWVAGKRAVGRVPSYDCAVFDLDGVITKTAKVHSLAWKATFDDYLKKQQGSQFQEFTEQDYLTYVDGKPRYDGVQSFLQSRGISLPFGDKNDPAGKETVCGIGNVKNDKFLEVLASSGIEPYDSTVRLLRELRAAGLRVGVASSSKNCEYVLKTAGLLDLMETRVDGVVSAELGLKGKPEPDIFVTAAKNLGCLPARTIVFEDAVSGVQAGAKGQFGLVVGLAREHNEDELRSAGADVVFDDWGNHTLGDLDSWLVAKAKGSSS